MFNRILIANRGEIACRIIKTAKKMGIETVAIYSTADKDSEHVRQADMAYCVGEAAAKSSYLNQQAVIQAAKDSQAEAIHPGYGFLSENADFAKACEAAGLVFIGPSVKAMQAMASKQLAKQLLEKTAVPLTPGYHGNEQSNAQLLKEAKAIGFPVLLKAASGGGGKGMRSVMEEKEFIPALEGARREAMASFADDTMIIEKLILQPRHVEIQVMADNHGQVVHLFERDCSIQRRHQKIIEEAPAPNLSPKLRQQLAKAACEVARSIDYRGAGTVEFLVAKDESFYFMEMNTRLQVEHPVTEMITGLDLVAWQLQIAANEPLPCPQDTIKAQGHAIECRIYAEDPFHNFVPSTGVIHYLKEPAANSVRIDSGVSQGSEISIHYDPMISKLIVWGFDRCEALRLMRQALAHYHIGGVKTNIPFLKAILANPQFAKAELSTAFLTEATIDMEPFNPLDGLKMAAAYDYLIQIQELNDPLLQNNFAWQMHLKGQWFWSYHLSDERHDIKITPIDARQFILNHGDSEILCTARLEDKTLQMDDGQKTLRAEIQAYRDSLILYSEEGQISVKRFSWDRLDAESGTQKGQLTSPMPATIVAILKNIGDRVKAGDRLVILEAMKMEHTIHAPSNGILSKLFYTVGSQVNEGAQLLALDEEPQPE